MNREEVQLLGFEIVAFAGDALIEEGNNCIAEAHRAQTSLLAKEAQGDDIAYSVTMMHGQDHLMTTILLKDLMKHLLEFYKRG
ncbi:TPA: PTS lactose/cellobiose transporter subunit IIA [Staphylococcus aureus]|nr:PTS lactose/cellobiose transporter subunit IIA [Staphylococcus aureus]